MLACLLPSRHHPYAISAISALFALPFYQTASITRIIRGSVDLSCVADIGTRWSIRSTVVLLVQMYSQKPVATAMRVLNSD